MANTSYSYTISGGHLCTVGTGGTLTPVTRATAPRFTYDDTITFRLTFAAGTFAAAEQILLSLDKDRDFLNTNKMADGRATLTATDITNGYADITVRCTYPAFASAVSGARFDLQCWLEVARVYEDGEDEEGEPHYAQQRLTLDFCAASPVIGLITDTVVPIEPQDVYYTKTETDELLEDKADLVNGKVPSSQLPEMDYIPTSQKGAANGVATLGSDSKVPSSQLPVIDSTRIVDGLCEIDADGTVKRPGAWTMSAFTKDDSKVTFVDSGSGTTPAPWYDWANCRWVIAPVGTFAVNYDDGEYSISGANCGKVYSEESPAATTIHFILDKDTGSGTVVIGTATGAASSANVFKLPVLPEGFGEDIPEQSLLMMGADGKLAKAVDPAEAAAGQFVRKTADGYDTATVDVGVQDVFIEGSATSLVSEGIATIPVNAANALVQLDASSQVPDAHLVGYVKKYAGSGAPTTATEGAVGDLYTDTATQKTYTCTAVSGSTFTWTDNINAYGGSMTGAVKIITNNNKVFLGTNYETHSGKSFLVVSDTNIRMATTGWTNYNGANTIVIQNLDPADARYVSNFSIFGGRQNPSLIQSNATFIKGWNSAYILIDSSNNICMCQGSSIPVKFTSNGGMSFTVTAIPAATSAYTLTEGVSSHAPSVAPTYTLPSVTDTTLTHECILYVNCANTASLVFQDAGGSAIVPQCATVPLVGEKWVFLCSYSPTAAKWVILGVREEEV